VIGLDFDPGVVGRLQAGQPPLFEPDLEDLLKRGLAQGCLSFTADAAEAVRKAEVVWVAYDTPVDEDDRADVGFVMERVTRLFPHLSAGTLVLISSQLPVGTTRRLEGMYKAAYPHKPVSFAYSPENLRLGKAIGAFTRPERVVVGTRSEADSERVALLFRPFTERIEPMSVESAEMTKHALNAFLATSVAFINEISLLCEQVGADAKEVERGLKSEPRIGPKAYLSPGAAFAGGTLARDITFLTQLGVRYGQPTHVLAAVKTSNDTHKLWVRSKLKRLFSNSSTGSDHNLRDKTIAVWGLTYKPGTDTLRRSSSVELCGWLAEQGARVLAHDPAVRELPAGLASVATLCPTPVAALDRAVALVVATEWPDYLSVDAESVVSTMRSPTVIDPNRFLANTIGNDSRIRYVTVGKALS
jgi:UDPglucose 6-dehydrogenase